jgi:hypothetical protein
MTIETFANPTVRSAERAACHDATTSCRFVHVHNISPMHGFLHALQIRL